MVRSGIPMWFETPLFANHYANNVLNTVDPLKDILLCGISAISASAVSFCRAEGITAETQRTQRLGRDLFPKRSFAAI